MAHVSTLQSLIAGRWLGESAAVPLHSALNNNVIYHTHAEKIDFEEAVTYARKTGVPGLMALDFQQRAAKLVAGAVEQLQPVALGHAQDPANVMGLGFRQLVFAEAERGVDEKAGQSHGGSLKSGRSQIPCGSGACPR